MTLTPAQLKIRKNRITGSTVASYMGYSPYQRPSEAWEINEGLREFTGNDDTEAGTEMEVGIAGLAAKRMAVDDWSIPDSILHPSCPEIWVVHPDRISLKEKLSMQVKNHMPFMVKTYKGRPGDAGRWDNEIVPLHIQMQCQWEMAALAAHFDDPKWAEWCILAAFFGGSNLRLYDIKFNRKLLEGMIRWAKIFWRAHLDPNGPKTRPTDEYWVGSPKQERRRVKLSSEDLEIAPLPFGESLQQPKFKMPFG